MIALIIIASLLFILAAGTTWLLLLVVRRNRELVLDNVRLEGSIKYLEYQCQKDYETILRRDQTIMAMEDGAVTLHLESQEREQGLHRIIGDLLLKQDKMIAGGGGSADPEDEYQETPEPLRLVTDG